MTNEQFSREADYLVTADIINRLLDQGIITEADAEVVSAYFIDRFKPIGTIPKPIKFMQQNSDNAPLCVDVFAQKSEH
jgi:hypothetical protein